MIVSFDGGLYCRVLIGIMGMWSILIVMLREWGN